MNLDKKESIESHLVDIITQLSHIKNHKFFIYERLIKPINRHILL